MKKILIGLMSVALMFAGIMACTQQESKTKAASDTQHASQAKTDIEYGLDGVVKNGTVDTRVGPLTFENGYPSRHSV